MTNNIDYSGFLGGEAAQKSTSLFRKHVIPSGTIVERGISSACHLRILPKFQVRIRDDDGVEYFQFGVGYFLFVLHLNARKPNSGAQIEILNPKSGIGMIYTQISFKLNPDTTENREILVAMLAELPFESFDETDEQMMGYIPGETVNLDEIGEITAFLPFTVELSSEVIPDKNWNEVWEKNYFKPLLIGGRCLVRAPFHTEYEPAEFELVIEPKMAFGTGNHETTTLVAEQILNMDLTGKSVLDMGCGTGILGMLASMKGARSVVAIDIDSWSYESTVENARLNNIQNLEARHGDASLLGGELFEIIFANIHKNVIVGDLPVYESVLQSGGNIYLSGFYTHDMPDVKAKAESLGLVETGFQEKNNWVVYGFRKK